MKIKEEEVQMMYPRKGKKLIAVLIMGALLSPVNANENLAVEKERKDRPAGGIRTDFGDVLIENLGIGETYNLRELAGTPMKVTNTGAGTLILRIDVQVPDMSFITPIRQELGFEPIPSVDWVELSQNQFVLPSGESALTDVIIKIPNDPSLYGRKFQASIFSRNVDTGFLNLGIWSHLQMTIIDSPESQAKRKRDRSAGFIGNMDYTLLPDKLSVRNVPIGKKIRIRDLIKRGIMVANSGENAIELRAKSVGVGDTPLTLQTGFKVPEDTSWMSFKDNVFKVGPASFYDPDLTLNIPNDKSLKGKKLMFVLKIEPADHRVVGVTYYGKIYVEIEK